MNFKTIIVGSLAVGLAIGGTLLNKVVSDESQSVYTPRTLNHGLYGQAAYAQYMHDLKADPATGKIDYNLVTQVKNEIIARGKQNNKAALGLNWTQMGPDNVGGRCRAIVVDKNNSNIVYAGSVGGGLYYSTDGTQTWNSVAGHNGALGENLAVSCITQTDEGRIFFGTGCTFETPNGNGGSGFIGNGVYEYVPATGQVLPVLTNGGALPNNSPGAQLTYINAIDSRGNRLYIGSSDGLIWADPDMSGLYPNTFSGWTNPIEAAPGFPEGGTVHDIDIASDGSMVVCFQNKMYLSPNDQLGSFTRQNITATRLAAAIAPSNPNVIYRISTNNVGLGQMRNFEMTMDRGANWHIVIPGGSGQYDPLRNSGLVYGQGNYDLALAVDPSDWKRCLVAGVRMFEFVYNPTSNPVGGSWHMITNEFQSPFNPVYVHADKHTFYWKDPNTIYIGSDGGIGRSVDGGQTWQQRNLGFNVTTFYDVATASNGWFVGGAQDNGNQLFTFGAFGEPTPLGTTEIQNSDPNLTFGDGFDVAFSNLSGLVFATAQFGAIIRTNSAGGTNFYDSETLSIYLQQAAASAGFHTRIEHWESGHDSLSIDSVKVVIDTNGYVNNLGDTIFPGDTIFAGDTINYTSYMNSTPLWYIAPSQIILDGTKDSLMLQDYLQSKFVWATNQGIFYTKDAANLGVSQLSWHKISTITNAVNFEFSSDGNHLFVGTSSGQVVRISGLSYANDSLGLDIGSGVSTLTQTFIASGLVGYVSLAADPNNADNVIAATSGYTNNNHVFRCTNATTASGPSGNFVAIQGGPNQLPRMPVYDVAIDFHDHNKVILGTEWGVWTTDNAFSATIGALVNWTDESSTGMAHVPVHGVEQQQLRSDQCVNSGFVYLGTHGRGFYVSQDLFTSVDEQGGAFNDNDDNNFISDLSVYPNPINNQGAIEFNLADRANATVKIYSLSGSLVMTKNLGMMTKGAHKENINVSSLSVGSYILSLESENKRSVAKFIVSR